MASALRLFAAALLLGLVAIAAAQVGAPDAFSGRLKRLAEHRERDVLGGAPTWVLNFVACLFVDAWWAALWRVGRQEGRWGGCLAPLRTSGLCRRCASTAPAAAEPVPDRKIQLSNAIVHQSPGSACWATACWCKPAGCTATRRYFRHQHEQPLPDSGAPAMHTR